MSGWRRWRRTRASSCGCWHKTTRRWVLLCYSVCLCLSAGWPACRCCGWWRNTTRRCGQGRRQLHVVVIPAAAGRGLPVGVVQLWAAPSLAQQRVKKQSTFFGPVQTPGLAIKDYWVRQRSILRLAVCSTHACSAQAAPGCALPRPQQHKHWLRQRGACSLGISDAVDPPTALLLGWWPLVLTTRCLIAPLQQGVDADTVVFVADPNTGEEGAQSRLLSTCWVCPSVHSAGRPLPCPPMLRLLLTPLHSCHNLPARQHS